MEELITKVREWLEDEIRAGKPSEVKYCELCKAEHLHVFKANWDHLILWTCYECGSTRSFHKNRK